MPCSEGGIGAIICQLCARENQRSAAHSKQAKQAEKMSSATSKRLQPLNVGANVAIPVPEVDRGRAEFRIILGVITNVTDDGLYEIGTRTGNLKQK